MGRCISQVRALPWLRYENPALGGFLILQLDYSCRRESTHWLLEGNLQCSTRILLCAVSTLWRRRILENTAHSNGQADSVIYLSRRFWIS